MPIVAVFEFPNDDIAKYHEVFDIGGTPILEQPNRLHHVCYRTETGWTVVDVWQRTGVEPNAHVGVGVDGDAFVQLLLERIPALDPK